MVEDEKVKKWLEEQEKIKSELSILAGSLKGTGYNYKDDKAQKIEDTILQEVIQQPTFFMRSCVRCWASM